MAKILEYTDEVSGAYFKSAYFNVKRCSISLRHDRQSIVFMFDGFATKDLRQSDKRPFTSVDVGVRPEDIDRYSEDFKTIPVFELAYRLANEYALFPGALDDI